MNHISLFIKDYSMPKMPGISNERQLLLYEFLEAINRDRALYKGKQALKPISARFMGYKLAHLKTWELKMFLADCKRAKNFGAYFWWSLKPQEEQPPF